MGGTDGSPSRPTGGFCRGRHLGKATLPFTGPSSLTYYVFAVSNPLHDGLGEFTLTSNVVCRF